MQPPPIPSRQTERAMTEKNLKALIDHLNKGKASEYIFLRPLTETVDFAIVWDVITHPLTNSKSLFGPLNFYFIKNSEGIYVSTVADKGTDLHWYVLPKHRGKGHLINSLKTTILPHLFQDNRSEQRITIDINSIGKKNYAASMKVAQSVGFLQTRDMAGTIELKISNASFSEAPYLEGQNSQISEDRIKFLADRARELGKELMKIESELEMKIGFTFDVEEIKEIAQSVNKIPNLIHEARWSANRNDT